MRYLERFVAASLALAGFLLTPGCGSQPLRIESDHVPTGSLRLGQAVVLVSAAEIRDTKELHDALLTDGVADSEIRDGSVVITRIYCCKGPNERETATMVYVPPTVQVERGDAVEYRVGHPAKGSEPAKMNVVTQIRQKPGAPGAVRWVPENDHLWDRILYADWMSAEGWVEQTGIWKAWYRPAP